MIARVSVWYMPMQDRDRLQSAKHQLFERFYNGKIQALVDYGREFTGVASVCDAVDYMLSGQAVGKVVVKLNS